MNGDSAAFKQETLPQSLTFYPFAYALLDEELDSFCWYCLTERELSVLKRCSACKTALFCDKQCQSIGWIDHRAECSGIVRTARNGQAVPGVEVRLLGRIVLRHKQILEGKDQVLQDFYKDRTSERSIMEIWSHADDMRRDQKAWQQFVKLLKELQAVYSGKFLLDEETIFQLHCRNFINRHAISDKAYLREIGKGLYLDLCAYDHSCAPNSIYMTTGFVASLRPLKKGIDIRDHSSTFYSYINLLATKIERQNMLRESWYFSCRCTRCVDPAEHLLTSLKCCRCGTANAIFNEQNYKKESFSCSSCSEPVSAEQIDKAVQCMRTVDQRLASFEQLTNERKLSVCQELLTVARAELPSVNIYHARILQQAIVYCEPLDYETLRLLHYEATSCLEICYPKNHPALSYHYLNMGIFCCQLMQNKAAIPWLQKAHESMSFVLGEDHTMTMKAKEELNHVS